MIRPGLFLLALMPSLAWSAGSVYKWVDANGETHYDDQNRLQQRLTRATIARGPVAAEPSATVPAELVAEVRRRCVDLRERAASMKTASKLYGSDPAGNVYRLSERQAALARAEAEREQLRYCNADAPRRFYREELERSRREQQVAEREQARQLASTPVSRPSD